MPKKVEPLWADCVTALKSLANLPIGSATYHSTVLKVITPLADLKRLAAAGHSYRQAEWDAIVNKLKVSCWLHIWESSCIAMPNWAMNGHAASGE